MKPPEKKGMNIPVYVSTSSCRNRQYIIAIPKTPTHQYDNLLKIVASSKGFNRRLPISTSILFFIASNIQFYWRLKAFKPKIGNCVYVFVYRQTII